MTRGSSQPAELCNWTPPSGWLTLLWASGCGALANGKELNRSSSWRSIWTQDMPKRTSGTGLPLTLLEARSREVIHAERAFELDPVAQVNSGSLGQALWVAGRIDEAIEQRRETIALAPEWPTGWYDLSQALLEVGEYEEGLEAIGRSLELANVDVQAGRDAYEAAIRYHQTGQLQTFSDFEWS